MRGLTPDKTKAEVFNRLRIFDVRSAIAGGGQARSHFLEQHSADFLDEGRLSLLPRLRIFDMQSAIARRGHACSHQDSPDFCGTCFTRVVFLSCLGTLQKRESWQTKRFSVGIVLTILQSPTSRRWLLRPYRKRPTKRLTSGGVSSKGFPEKNASSLM